MALYRYKALNARGELLDGQMEAASDGEVVARLQEQGHLPVEARLASEGGGGTSLRSLFQPKPFAGERLVQFTQQLATLLGAVGTYLLRKHQFLCTLAPVVSNIIIIPLVLRYGYGLTMDYGGRDWSIPFYMLTVGAGEIICCCVLGTILLNALAKVRNAIFKKED